MASEGSVGGNNRADGSSNQGMDNMFHRIVLHDQGNPTLKISSILLNGSNYLPWSKSVHRFI
ncbi:hypothetical protein QML37_29590, partial [Klebsiella pneumoniae]|uniref:hypothetical protein n=1 Tax=Klebsiella pneumoniae TaxID=573 RepID=UPI003A805F27